ncbi:MAG: EF-hand domain-containing protein [Planctomycetes bacterium]|nr:EF-hand domain-containing protein [Planctomycetota bacterium]
MNRRRAMTLALVLAVAAAPLAIGRWARSAHAGDEGRAFIDLCDSNGDGSLTLDEFPFGEDLFTAADGDGDGLLTGAELAALRRAKDAAKPGLPRELNAIFRKHDQDRDGRISRAECPPDGRERFDRVDQDHDGFVTRAEAGRVAAGRAGGELRATEEARQKFAALDRDGDGALSGDELPAEARPFLATVDADGDQRVSRAEVEAAEADGRLKRIRGAIKHFAEADADQDGAVVRAEFPLTADVEFDALDEDGDERITIEEVAGFVANRYGTSPKGFVARYDRDADGRVARAEFRGADEAFDRLDADGDGYVTAAEAGE